MKKVYTLVFTLLLTLLAVSGAQAGATTAPSMDKFIQTKDPVSSKVRCWLCSDDMTLCVEVFCPEETPKSE